MRIRVQVDAEELEPRGSSKTRTVRPQARRFKDHEPLRINARLRLSTALRSVYERAEVRFVVMNSSSTPGSNLR